MAGTSYNVQVPGAVEAATFLATDFMDNGGKCSPAIYRDSNQLNYNSQTYGGTASPGFFQGSVLICKTVANADGTGTPINRRWSFLGLSYLTGEGFGNLNADWEWIKGSMLVRDNRNLGANSNYYTFISGTGTINQSVSSTQYVAGSKGTIVAPAYPFLG